MWDRSFLYLQLKEADELKLSVVIPCYNEADNIPLILKRFQEVIGDRNIQVVLVNNGSTDNSEEILEKLLPAYAFASVVRVPINKGYGYGILEGLKHADGDFLGWTHADMQTDPNDIVRAWELIKANGENPNIFVKGNRQGRPLVDKFFSIGMGLFESIYLGKFLWEINAQPNIFSRKFYCELRNPPYDFSFDLYILYMAKIKRQDIKRITVEFPQRMHGTSKWNTSVMAKWKFIKRTLSFSLRLKNGGFY